MANREEVATFTFMGVTERVVIGEEENGQWKMFYLRANGSVQACINDAQSREEVLALTKQFMDGHGQALVQNVIESSEIFLGSMNS